MANHGIRHTNLKTITSWSEVLNSQNISEKGVAIWIVFIRRPTLHEITCVVYMSDTQRPCIYYNIKYDLPCKVSQWLKLKRCHSSTLKLETVMWLTSYFGLGKCDTLLQTIKKARERTDWGERSWRIPGCMDRGSHGIKDSRFISESEAERGRWPGTCAVASCMATLSGRSRR